MSSKTVLDRFRGKTAAYVATAATALAAAPVAAQATTTPKPKTTASCLSPQVANSGTASSVGSAFVFTWHKGGKSYNYQVLVDYTIDRNTLKVHAHVTNAPFSEPFGPGVSIDAVRIGTGGTTIAVGTQPVGTTLGNQNVPSSHCAIPINKDPKTIDVYVTYQGKRISKNFHLDVHSQMTVSNAAASPAQCAKDLNPLKYSPNELVGDSGNAKPIIVCYKGHAYTAEYGYRFQNGAFSSYVALLDNLDGKGFGPALSVDPMVLMQNGQPPSLPASSSAATRFTAPWATQKRVALSRQPRPCPTPRVLSFATSRATRSALSASRSATTSRTAE